MPLPAIMMPPVLDVAELVATLNVTVPLLVPELPAVTEIHGMLVVAVQEIFAITPIIFPFAAALVKFVLVGLIASENAAPACVTVQVRVSPPLATMTPPVRDEVAGLVATLNVTVPLPDPEAPPVMAIHETLEAAVHATLAETPIVRPVVAVLEKFVLVGLIESDSAFHNAVGRPNQVSGTVGQPAVPKI